MDYDLFMNDYVNGLVKLFDRRLCGISNNFVRKRKFGNTNFIDSFDKIVSLDFIKSIL